MAKKILSVCATWLSLSTLTSQSLIAEQPQETVPKTRIAQASRTMKAPLIDGLVEKDEWSAAKVITGFTQAEPYEGAAATEKTEVRILYDNQAIYIGVICFDTAPNKIVTRDQRRDSSLDDSDSFQIILDTYMDHQNGFLFATNPAGMEYDGQVSKEGEAGTGRSGRGRAQSGAGGGFNLNWDTTWDVQSQTGDYGWSAELLIPLRSLRYSAKKSQVWGLNFQRNIRRKREQVYWSPVSRIYNIYRVSAAGELHGLELAQPRNFKVTPYVLASSHRDFQLQDSNKLNTQFGVDAKFGITQSLNLDLTVNTDFAQVEVDTQQINLTRFNLFFPEKRGFFLENSGNFVMGKGRQVELFFSRSIGLGNTGQVIPIKGGARISGKAGRYNVGLINMQTNGLSGLSPANNFTVASVRRDLPNHSSLGAIFVNRNATNGLAREKDYNRTFGLDGKWGIGKALTINGFAARTETPEVVGDESAYNIGGEIRKRVGRASIEYTQVGAQFNPEAGFLSRRNYRNLEVRLFGHWRPQVYAFGKKIVREFRPHISYKGFWDFKGFKETESIHIDSHVDFENGAFFSPAVQHTVEGLTEPFEIYPDIIVAPGTYRHWEITWRWNTNESKAFSYSGILDYGGFLSGKRRSIDTTLNYRLDTTFITSIAWSYNDIRLREGNFTANLVQWQLAYNFSPFIYLQGFVQYNDRANIWSSNIRFTWLTTASTGLFIVYNDTQGFGDIWMGPKNRSLMIKYNYQLDIFN